MLESWKIPIFQYLQRKYWNPETCQYSNISWGNIGILECGKFQYSFQWKMEIQEYWNIEILENTPSFNISKGKIGILEYCNHGKFSYSNISRGYNEILAALESNFFHKRWLVLPGPPKNRNLRQTSIKIMYFYLKDTCMVFGVQLLEDHRKKGHFILVVK